MFTKTRNSFEMKASNLDLSDIKVGKVYQFKRKITFDDGIIFAKLTGDFNPLHTDVIFGGKSKFKKNIAHGMLAGIMFSTLIGMYCPGTKSLYLSQTFNFRLPIFYDDILTVKGKVTAKNESTRVVTLKTEILKNGRICVNGETRVQLLDI